MRGAESISHTVSVFLSITSTASPATDLGYLLHKHPGRAQAFDMSVGQAHVFYPQASEKRCTAALLLEVDPIGLVRGRKLGGADAFSLAQYVNDRPYAASSMLSVALAKVFRTAMAGRCDARPDLVDQALPLEIHVPVLPCRGGPETARRVFEPLGWTVSATAIALDPQMPEWGVSRYVDLRLTGAQRVADALNHLYVLLPVLDDAKHYWVSPDEVDKLVRAGEGWLRDHPERDMITRRYLAHQRELVLTAVGRLAEVDDAEPEALDNAVTEAEEQPEPQVTLAEQRRGAVVAALKAAGARRVVDLGCGEGALVRELLHDPTFTEILAVDVSPRALEIAGKRLRLDRLPDRQRERVRLLQSSVTYRDGRLTGYGAVVLTEVVEHVDPSRLPALERAVFGYAAPETVVVTTPNVEHNARFDDLAKGSMRHRDHRFEWTRDEFRSWAGRVADQHGYSARFLPVGADDPGVGPPTQMAVFTRTASASADASGLAS